MVSVRLEPMSREQYVSYRAAAEEGYAASLRESGALPEAEARTKAAEDYARLLPDGVDTEGHLLWTAYETGADVDADADAVGMLWLELRPTSEGLTAFGYDFSVREDLRRTGVGRAIMLAAEDECRRLGVVSVALNVFGQNLAAQALYEQMGFRVTGIQMVRML